MKSLKVQLILVFKRKSFIISLAVMCLFSMVAFLVNCYTNYGECIISVPAAKYLFIGSMHYNMFFPRILYWLFPLMVVLPFADTYFEERDAKSAEYYLIRCNNNQYYFSKFGAVFFSGIFVILIPLLINFLLNLLAFPFESSVDFTNFSKADTWVFSTLIDRVVTFKGLLVNNMYLYILAHIFLFSLAGGLIAVIVFQLSFFYKNSRIILNCFFFIIYHIYILVFDSFRLGEFCFDNYLFAFSSSSSQTIKGLFVTWGLLIVSAILPIPIAKRKLRDIYD